MRALPLIWILAAGCAPDGTRVRLTLRYDAAWQLDGVEVMASPHPGADVKVAHALVLLVPDDQAGRSMGVELWGTHAGERRAWGRADVTPVRGSEVSKEVVLTRLPCGAWCTPGAVECSGTSTVACAQSADGCTDWGAPAACASPSPFCAFGACAATCRDECAAGETRCEGSAGVRTCGHLAADSCLHWLPPVACGAGLVCSNGACAATCSDECVPGAVSCLEGGVISCGDLNHDGCLEWSPIVPCATGTCSAGVCSATCSDDCSASECSGLVYRACGKFGPDDCNHLSAGVSCVPSDPCQAGRCGAGGCEMAPLVCEAPPASECVDGSTLRVYDMSGTCMNGTCSYGSHDVACANCPACSVSPSPSCAPACAGKSCGADDGCGGKCGHGCWTTGPSLPVAMEDPGIVTLADGRIFVLGGQSDTNAALDTVQEFTPGTPGSWSQPTTLPTPLIAPAAAVGSDGRIYLIGGSNTDDSQRYGSVEVYTPDVPGVPGHWDSAPSLKTPREGLGAVAAGDGRIYALGGAISSIADTASVEAFTPGGTSWVSAPSFSGTRSFFCAALGSDGRIYIASGEGGGHGLSTVQAYSIVGGSWSTLAPIPTARDGVGCATSTRDGRLYAAGGYDGMNTLDVVEAYSPATNQWSTIPPMPTKRSGAAVTAALDGSIYVIGGLDATLQHSLDTVEIYTP